MPGMSKSKPYKRHSKVIWGGVRKGPEQRQIIKVGRNDVCPCGSGKKYKDCHESHGSAYLEKLAWERERERLRGVRAEMKARGVPWYRRLFWFQ